jgi:hypothetical protein
LFLCFTTLHMPWCKTAICQYINHSDGAHITDSIFSLEVHKKGLCKKIKNIRSPKIQGILKKNGWLRFYVRQDHKKDGLFKNGRIELWGPIISAVQVAVCNQCVECWMLKHWKLILGTGSHATGAVGVRQRVAASPSYRGLALPRGGHFPLWKNQSVTQPIDHSPLGGG